MMIAMQPEVLSGLIGFGGALVGGATSLGGVWLTLSHQKKQTRETRLQEIGQVAVDEALNELITLGEFLKSVRGEVVTMRTDESAEYLVTVFDHMERVQRAVARIPDRDLRTRVRDLLVIMRKFRAAGVRHFFAVSWLVELADELTELLSAYIRSDPLPPLSARTEEKQQRAIQYELAQRRHFELMQDPDPANIDPREQSADLPRHPRPPSGDGVGSAP
ncbi:hypothetical protein ABZV65_27795 [Streptomyces bauhiniae]|uniref:hypothetical protein n=1 Tax=Streptomyces bauhiniae TaxID=2340725 RepID=UPI0033A2697D